MYCDSSARTCRSISVNTVNHRLADGIVNCGRGNNKTQRMLLLIDTRTVTDKRRTDGVCVCVCEFTLNSEECLEVKVVGRSNVKFDPANAWPCFWGMSPS